MKLTVEIDNLTEPQAIALEDMFATWHSLGSMGSSRWTAFYADGDGNFHPKITVNGRKPQITDLISRDRVWPKGHNGDYKIDFDAIAWKLK